MRVADLVVTLIGVLAGFGIYLGYKNWDSIKGLFTNPLSGIELITGKTHEQIYQELLSGSEEAWLQVANSYMPKGLSEQEQLDWQSEFLNELYEYMLSPSSWWEAWGF